MRRSRGVGIVILALVGVSGCAGMPQRGRTATPAATEGAVAQSRFSLRGWWSRWRKPEPAPVVVEGAPVTDLRIETSSRAVPERDIWPDRSRSILSRLRPSFSGSRTGDRGPILGANSPRTTLTPAEANRAIAGMARPRKTTGDDYVLPVRMWGDPDQPPSQPATPRPPAPFEDEPTPPSTLPSPIPLPGSLLDRYSKHPEVGADSTSQEVSAGSGGSENAGRSSTRDQAAVPASAPSADDPDATLASTTQLPPPPPVRPTTRPDPATTTTPPPAPPVTTAPPPPAAPEIKPVRPEEARPEPTTPAQSTAPQPARAEAPAAAESAAVPAEAPAPTPAVAAEPPVQTAAPQAASQFVAPAPQSRSMQTPALVASHQHSDSGTHRSWFLKWLRPSRHEHEHGHPARPTVYATPQSPAQLPPVLVPTSYRTVVSKPTAAPSGQLGASPTLKQAFVMPSPQTLTPVARVKEPCFLVTRLHMRLEQFRRWKHEHICKNIQSFKEGLAGKHCCQSCGSRPVAPFPTASPQGRFSPLPVQAQAQAQAGLRAEPGHVAEGRQVVEAVAAKSLDEAPKR